MLLDELPHRVTWSRRIYTDDGDADVPSLIAEGSAVEAWVQNASRAEVRDFQVRDQSVSHVVYFREAQTMRPGDEIVVSSGPSFIGLVLTFIAASDRSAGLGVLWGAMFDEKNTYAAGV